MKSSGVRDGLSLVTSFKTKRCTGNDRLLFMVVGNGSLEVEVKFCY